MPDEEEQPPEEDSSGEEERKRDESGKFKKKEPEAPEEPGDKEEPEGEITEISDDEITEYFKKAQEKEKDYQTLLTFKANRMKEIDDYETRLKAQRTKEDQKLKGFKEEKKSEGDQTVIAPLYKKMSFKNLTETSKKMRKK
ncbi:unnamed protein product [marine sediment metagenome]|uniref:Uncharacterized protein n=1 Tax=marine sediment metagenome TaxID=412755 RepID=X1DEC1_9ZZZZ